MERRKLGRLVKEKKVKLGTTKRRKLGRLVKKQKVKLGTFQPMSFIVSSSLSFAPTFNPQITIKVIKH